jgi:hypothetical protein
MSNLCSAYMNLGRIWFVVNYSQLVLWLLLALPALQPECRVSRAPTMVTVLRGRFPILQRLWKVIRDGHSSKRGHLPPSQPSCIINAASAIGKRQVAQYSREGSSVTWSSNPSSSKVDDREPLQSRGLLQEVIRGLNLLGEGIELLVTH